MEEVAPYFCALPPGRRLSVRLQVASVVASEADQPSGKVFKMRDEPAEILVAS
jgi:uncharacterized lipoprotein YbaY